LNELGMPILEESRLQSTPRYGRTRIVGNPSTYTKNQNVLKIGNHSRKLSRPLKEPFLIPKSRRLSTKVIDLGNS